MLALAPPDARRPLRVLCLGAHADDIEIGCGGTLQDVTSQRPVVVDWVVLSAPGERAQEARRGAAAFARRARRTRVAVHAFRDGFFPAEYAALKDAFEALKSAAEAPDLVFTHGRDDLHQDHRIIAELTWSTFRRATILEYEIPKYDGDLGRPNVYHPLSAAQARRKAATLLRVFPSQAARSWFTAETFLGLMRLRGIECHAPGGYAEAFHGRKLVL